MLRVVRFMCLLHRQVRIEQPSIGALLISSATISKNNITRSWDRPDFESDILTEIAKQNIPKSLFDKIKNIWTTFALTDVAKKQIEEMRPTLDETELAMWQRQTTEAKVMMCVRKLSNKSETVG